MKNWVCCKLKSVCSNCLTNLFEVKGGKVCGNSKLVASSSDTPETSVNTIDAETAKKAVELGISCHQAVRFS